MARSYDEISTICPAGLAAVREQQPPTRSGDKMKMVVDGVELTKVD
jgi:hypothetical protein